MLRRRELRRRQPGPQPARRLDGLVPLVAQDFDGGGLRDVAADKLSLREFLRIFERLHQDEHLAFCEVPQPLRLEQVLRLLCRRLVQLRDLHNGVWIKNAKK